MNLTLQSLLEYDLLAIADLFNRSFEGYIVPAQLKALSIHHLLRREALDLSASRAALYENEPVAVAFINGRGRVCRLGAFGVFKDWRGKGVGRWLMEQVIAEAKARGDSKMRLEVIEQNLPAVNLYRSMGFQTVQRLIGFRGENPVGAPAPYSEVDPLVSARRLIQHAPNLPWQVCGETLLVSNPNLHAFQYGGTSLFVEFFGSETALLRGMLRGTKEEVQTLFRALFVDYPGRNWRVVAIFPELLVQDILPELGFTLEPISQWEMVLNLLEEGMGDPK